MKKAVQIGFHYYFKTKRLDEAVNFFDKEKKGGWKLIKTLNSPSGVREKGMVFSSLSGEDEEVFIYHDNVGITFIKVLIYEGLSITDDYAEEMCKKNLKDYIDKFMIINRKNEHLKNMIW